MCPYWAGRWLRWFAHPFGGAGGACSTLLLLPTPSFVLQALQKWQLGILISFVQNLPQLCIPIVIFSPIQFLCILFLEKRCVQVQGLQRKRPRSQLVSMPSERLPYS